MKKVGRPRKPSTEKKEIISVNLTASLIQKLNHDLSWSQSRSEWIERAIKEKLAIISDAAPAVVDTPTKSLAAALVRREDCPNFVVRAIISQYGWVDDPHFEDLKK
ncbi:unnamed protein product [marine sediment metagenome]|uniref:Uncharacterized protein n=2 Tax=marine sediment metagenome TaxID=412755 RepID=X1CGX6_9ZZZZ